MSGKLSIGSKSRVAIIGEGIIGLSLALELSCRGFAVTVVERARSGERSVGQASWAAAGMLAAEDPHNPEALRELSRWSAGLYDAFLARIAEWSGIEVPYQTQRTVQFSGGRRLELAERSVDPRQVVTALERAVEAAGGSVLRGVEVGGVEESAAGVRLVSGLEADQVVWANGSWCRAVQGMRPRKGQMMRVALPDDAPRDVVHRAEEIYVVPRTAGPEAGTALIGATVEDCGFDEGLDAAALEALRGRAAELVPEIGDARRAPLVEAWVGFRPATPGEMPVIDRVRGTRRQFVATGHFRNGILLAPATAVALADMIEGRASPVDLARFRYPTSQLAQSER